MKKKTPILLSFYALSNGVTNLVFGQLSYDVKDDLSFKEYNWRKTFRTIVSLYRTRNVASQDIELHFNHGHVKTCTDASGSFYLKVSFDEKQTTLQSVKLSSGEKVTVLKDLYIPVIDYVENKTIVISDIDDTLLHSFISNKLMKFATLMFTTVEKRKAVDNMMRLLKGFSKAGCASFYLSNSEQNLYPLIYRFLMNNQFPEGPLFLKQMRRLRDVFTQKKYPEKDAHKLNQLNQIMELFPDKTYVLVGDNTQNDLKIYLTIARKFPTRIKYIIIREVIKNASAELMVEEARDFLKVYKIGLHYAEQFPEIFEL